MPICPATECAGSCCKQEKDPRAYQFCLQLPDGASFLGSSPEQLYSRTANSIASEAVAATRARGPLGEPCIAPISSMKAARIQDLAGLLMHIFGSGLLKALACPDY